jgi:cell division protein FtsW (lipid II flippase)
MLIITKIKIMIVELLPIVGMILLIPFVKNDYALLAVHLIIIAIMFYIKYIKLDWLFFVFALITMTASEALFISTGVEVFERNSLFGLMPIWLPVLWAYVFVVMRRLVKVLEE